MPPSVARSQLLKVPEHATKEPLASGETGAFLNGCCTNNTQPHPLDRRKSLFIKRIPDRLTDAPAPRRAASPKVHCLAERQLSPESCPDSGPASRKRRLSALYIHDQAQRAFILVLESLDISQGITSGSARPRVSAADRLVHPQPNRPVALEPPPRAGRTPARQRVGDAGNLPLAARRRVGHIGRIGDVAEWLKAAVC